MADYPRMYKVMFNAVTDAERLITQASTLLQAAQQKCEEIYLEEDDTPLRLMDKPDETEE